MDRLPRHPMETYIQERLSEEIPQFPATQFQYCLSTLTDAAWASKAWFERRGRPLIEKPDAEMNPPRATLGEAAPSVGQAQGTEEGTFSFLAAEVEKWTGVMGFKPQRDKTQQKVQKNKIAFGVVGQKCLAFQGILFLIFSLNTLKNTRFINFKPKTPVQSPNLAT